MANTLTPTCPYCGLLRKLERKMNVNQVIEALKTTVQYSSNLYGAQPLILSSAAKLLEDCMSYLKSDSTPAQARHVYSRRSHR